MTLGLASAAVLAAGGYWLKDSEPAWHGGALSAAAADVVRAWGRAQLKGSLPADPSQQAQALDGLVSRMETAIAAFPTYTQDELAQLLTLLASAPGRIGLAGLQTPWSEATDEELHKMFAGMQRSRISLKQQAYLGLHDLIGAAYFSEAHTWTVLGYPGPQAL